MNDIKYIFKLALALVILIILPNMIKAEPKVTIFAAASLTEVTRALANDFGGNNKASFKFNFASSGQLARQIEAGAPADIFLSANIKWLDYTVNSKKLPNELKAMFAKNRLVFIQNLNKSSFIKIDFTKSFSFNKAFSGRIAMGDPRHVPAGQYAMEALKKLGWYHLIANRILPCSSVREALRMIELNEWELGISYLTDALASKKVKVIATFPEELHSPIKYGACIINGDSYISKNFLNYLKTEPAQKILESYGFQKLKD